jgi:mannose-6-phosphate isomerase-like protein (cupin superfamily)
VEKPWGCECVWAETDNYCGKFLYVNKGQALSLQYHETKDETMYVKSGCVILEIGPLGEELESLELVAGDIVHIPPYTVHRLVAARASALVMEVSTPHLDDVVRLEDRYGRRDQMPEMAAAFQKVVTDDPDLVPDFQVSEENFGS